MANEDGDRPPAAPPTGEEVQPAEEVVSAARTLPLPPGRGDTLPAPGAIPGYQILGELGRGAMGVVYRARQAVLDRTVALKMILAGSYAGPQEVFRFRAEAQAAARLQHPNIVQVYHVGEHEGLPFFSLEYVEGGSLASRLDGTPWPGRDAAALVRTLAEAVHRAHQQGVVHRDLKPANVLLTPDGIPKVADFGLAKLLDEAGAVGAHTPTGAVVGTPQYMAPEQAGGTGVGPAADVYALGAILYELLTGRPPFRAETPLDTILQVRSNQPAPPRLLNSKVDRDLEMVCLKCLEKDPTRRFATAEELADDLTRYLRGDAVRARSVNLLARVGRVLEASGHGPEFRNWSSLLLWLAAIVFVGHLATFFVLRAGLPRGVGWLSPTLQLALGGLVFWRYRPQTILPTTMAERLLWSIWIGYFLAYLGAGGLRWLLIFTGVLVAGPTAPAHAMHLLMFPLLSLLAGLAVFIMGSTYWGRYYLFGLAFITLATVMPLWLEGAPLALGTLAAACLLASALHLRRLGSEAGAGGGRSPPSAGEFVTQPAREPPGTPGRAAPERPAAALP